MSLGSSLLFSLLILTSDCSDQPGTFLFYDYDALKDVPEPDGRCMQVDYTPNHMIFFTKLEDGTTKEYALVSRVHPVFVVQASIIEITISAVPS